jgi:hypothetical protein
MASGTVVALTPRGRLLQSSELGPARSCHAGVAVLSDGTKRLVSLEVFGAESGSAWEGLT